jgi:hypothetical protein
MRPGLPSRSPPRSSSARSSSTPGSSTTPPSSSRPPHDRTRPDRQQQRPLRLAAGPRQRPEHFVRRGRLPRLTRLPLGRRLVPLRRFGRQRRPARRDNCHPRVASDGGRFGLSGAVAANDADVGNTVKRDPTNPPWNRPSCCRPWVRRMTPVQLAEKPPSYKVRIARQSVPGLPGRAATDAGIASSPR